MTVLTVIVEVKKLALLLILNFFIAYKIIYFIFIKVIEMADDHDKQNHFKKYDCVVCNSAATQTCEPLLPPPPSSTSILLKGSS